VITASAKISRKLMVFNLDNKNPVAFLCAKTYGLTGWRRDRSLEGEGKNPACGLNTFTRGAQ
jgi:hypothetical protein